MPMPPPTAQNASTMGSQLDDALRAAWASASAPPAESPARKRNANKRLRRRSRSESMASEGEDPAQRIQAFQARMFEVDTPSATFSPAPTGADDVVKVHWKAKRPAPGPGQRNGLEQEDGDAIPQLTRARVVSNGETAVDAQPAAKSRAAKKKKKRPNGKKTQPQVVEIKVPTPTVPAKSTVSAKPTALAKTTVSAKPTALAKSTVSAKPKAVEKVAGATQQDSVITFANELADVKSSSEDEGGESVSDAITQAGTSVAIEKESESETVSNGRSKDLLPARKQLPTLPTKAAAKLSVMTTKTTTGISPTTPLPETTKVVPKRPNQAINKSQAAKMPPPKPTKLVQPVTCSVTARADESDDEWDLDKLVKETVRQAASRKSSISDDEDDRELGDDDMGNNYEDSDFGGKEFRNHQMHLFSQLIDEAARERWELVEVGRLVRIFAAKWSDKKKKTARFLRRYCPELVSVDFLEGLNIPLTSKQLLRIFERGSGSLVVVMNKLASAIENGNLSVHDDDVLQFVASKADSMATNREILEFLLPLLESLSKVKDVGVLLKAICAHWHVDRTASLVQEVLLTPIFDDLDGQPDVILEDLPALEGRLDFPSCMDDEDADENGNLAGLIAGEDSDLGESDAQSEDEAEEKLGEILSDDADGEDSHAEDEVYEGETDSEEEREARERLSPSKRRRSRFILDEADEDDCEDEDEEEEGFVVDDNEDDSDSSEDSSDDDESAKPQRKRLRRG